MNSSNKFAIAFYFYDYGWYIKLLHSGLNGTTADDKNVSVRRDGELDSTFDGVVYDTAADAIAAIKTASQQTLKELTAGKNVDYADGRRAGGLAVVQLDASATNILTTRMCYDAVGHGKFLL